MWINNAACATYPETFLVSRRCESLIGSFLTRTDEEVEGSGIASTFELARIDTPALP